MIHVNSRNLSVELSFLVVNCKNFCVLKCALWSHFYSHNIAFSITHHDHVSIQPAECRATIAVSWEVCSLFARSLKEMGTLIQLPIH